MPNRLNAEAVILKWIGKIDPSGKNVAFYEERFKAMSDAQFDKWMIDIENRQDYVSIIDENFNDSKITTRNNLAVGKEMGVQFFQKLWLTDHNTGMEYLTPLEYLIVDMPVRRQIQLLIHKASIPEDSRHLDELTDQPTGVSKGSSVSLPETLVLYAQGLDSSITELIKFRGGDLKAMNAMEREIMQTGGVRMESISKLGTRVKSTETLSTLFKGMHLDNNF